MSEVLTNYFGDVSSSPAVIVDADSIDEVIEIVKQRKKYPAPLRPIGSNHSTTPCGAADGGTIIRMRRNAERAPRAASSPRNAAAARAARPRASRRPKASPSRAG